MMIEGMQISVHTPMFNITAPGNLLFLQDKMLTIASFDLIPEEYLYMIWGNPSTSESDEVNGVP